MALPPYQPSDAEAAHIKLVSENRFRAAAKLAMRNNHLEMNAEGDDDAERKRKLIKNSLVIREYFGLWLQKQ